MKFFNGIVRGRRRGDRAASTTSAARSHTNYPWGWAQAGNTPLRWYKQNTYGGGVRDR